MSSLLLLFADDSAAGFAAPTGTKLWVKADAGVFQDAARTTPVTASSDPVGGIEDQSGSGNHLSQGTANARPAWITGVLNGLPAFRPDGSNDQLVTAAPVSTATRTVYVAALVSLADTSRRGAMLNNGGAATGWAMGVGANNMDTLGNECVGLKNGQAHVDPNITIGTGGHVLEYRIDGDDDWAIRVDGGTEVEVASAVQCLTPAGTTQFLGHLATANRQCNYDVVELLVIDPDPGTAERDRVMTYLKSRGNIA